MPCIFCKIAAGEIPSEKVAENDRAFAFLDIRPLARGHVLVVPKRHSERIAEMAPEDSAAVMALVQDVLRRQGKALGVAGCTVAVNDGRAAGQEVPHVHFHLVPRHEGDGHGPIHALFKTRPDVQAAEIKEIAARIRA